MIQVTQNADGSLLLVGATRVTVGQVANGLTITASDTLALPIDTGPLLAAKIAKAKINVAIAAADVAKIGAELV